MSSKWARPIGLGIVAMFVAITLSTLAIGMSTEAFTPKADIGHDVYNYFAAGQRLNDGHELYEVGEGDLPVELRPPYWSVPLVAPPFAGVIWQPFTALGDLGIVLWFGITTTALLGSAAYVIWRSGPLGAALVALLAPDIGHSIASGNINTVFLVAMILAYRFPNSRLVALSAGLLTAAKLSPGVILLWLAGRGKLRLALSFGGLGVAIGVALGIAGAGLDATLNYPAIFGSSQMSPYSWSALTGIKPLSLLIFAGGSLLAAAIARRSPALSFIVLSFAVTAGNPSLWPYGWSMFLGAGVAFADWKPTAKLLSLVGWPMHTTEPVSTPTS